MTEKRTHEVGVLPTASRCCHPEHSEGSALRALSAPHLIDGLGRMLRTEAATNHVNDYGVAKAMDNLPEDTSPV